MSSNPYEDESQGNSSSSLQINQLNTIFIIASITAVMIILPVGIVIICIIRRCKKAVVKSYRQTNTEMLPIGPLNRINEVGIGSVTHDSMEKVNIELGETRMNKKDTYQTLNDAIVFEHNYQSIGELPIDSSQEWVIDNERSNYEPLSRRNIVQSDNMYEQS